MRASSSSAYRLTASGVGRLSIGCRQTLDVDLPRAELLEGAGVGPHPAVRAGADDQPFGKLVEHLVEVLEDECVALAAPPGSDDSARENDYVFRVLLAVDEYPSECVVLDPRHVR